ncbi:hypothetical protein CAPTEDRAFT_203137 [Capitella teleta]|uniref:Mitotic spindle assembly checkpoint protein MAD2B n=1 Tax=Capitella teleta TaxID=283909 RepID=R7T3Y2_CAPTE|nr:hypothetical protein CAPTEDRAFT_203137 [Capitella teleta]|eukprot:ELT87557.1 hypothetical protein CAPTEDRAFT_203137 [Capitella teleta]
MEVDKATVVADVLCEFFEVAFHSILYVRNLYPLGCFEQRLKYNVPVQMCCHPDVKQYIGELISSLKVLLLKNSADYIKFVICKGNGDIIERFVFEVDHQRMVKDFETDSFLLTLNEKLRGFLLKLSTCDSLLTETHSDRSWTVQVHTNHSGLLQMQEIQCTQDFSWVSADDAEIQMENASLIPVKSMVSFPIKMQLYIEEKDL